MKRVGFVGWRGMVGSVLMERMGQERDFDLIDEPVFFTTSQLGQAGPDIGKETPLLQDATDIEALMPMEAIVTCQGGGYTGEVYPRLRAAGWQGYWIDAASTLRMADDSIIILDPVNRDVIDRGLQAGVRDYVGGNCTVSLMLMAHYVEALDWQAGATRDRVLDPVQFNEVPIFLTAVTTWRSGQVCPPPGKVDSFPTVNGASEWGSCRNYQQGGAT